MNNKGVEMTNNKEIIELIRTTEIIVNESDVDDNFREMAFSKVFDLLLKKSKYAFTDMIDIGEGEKGTEMPLSAELVKSAKTFAGFLRQTNAQSHAQKVLCAAYYFLKQDKMTFTKEEIENIYQEAFLPKSKNTNADINSLIKQGRVMATKEKIEGKKSYQITMDGISFVEMELMRNVSK